MKKIFARPTIEVVRINNNDIVTESLFRGENVTSGNADAPSLRGFFDPSDDWANAGY